MLPVFAVSVATVGAASAATDRGASDAGSVSGVSVALSTTAAGASQVTYTLGFTASGDLPTATGAVVVAAPARTVWGGTWGFTDLTDGATGGMPTYRMTTSNNGATVSVPVPFEIFPGDQIRISATGVTSPPVTGAQTLGVSTTADPAVVTSPSYTLTAANPAAAVSGVTLSATAAGASQVMYGFGFTTSATGGLVPGAGAVVVSAPARTLLGSGVWSFTDVTSGTTGGVPSYNMTTTNNGATVSAPVPFQVYPGDQIRITANTVTSPPTAGTDTLTLSTTSDTTPVTLPSYTLTAPNPVAAVSGVTLNTTAATASEVSYGFGFTASATGYLAPGAGAVIVSAPARTLLGSGVWSFTDVTSGTTGGVPSYNMSTSNNGATVSAPVPFEIFPGDRIQITATGVTSPPTAETGTMTLSTTSDTTPVTLPSYTLTPPNAVAAVSGVTLTTPACGATQVTYTFGFTASATGDLIAGAGHVLVSAPARTVWGGGSWFFTDVTDGATGGVPSYNTSTSNNDSSVSIPVPFEVYPGDTVQITIAGVTNPPITGAVTVTLSTTSDTTAVGIGYTLTNPNPVASPTVSLSSNQTGATAAYTVGFTASQTGGLAAGSGSVTLTGPSGTVFGGPGTYQFKDLTSGAAGSFAPSQVSTSGGGTILTIPVPVTVAAGDQVQIVAPGTTNAPTTGANALTIVTTSDTTPASASYQLTASALTATAVTVSPSGKVLQGDLVTLTATVSPAAAGTVQFYDGATALGAPVPTSGGTAAYTSTKLALGAHSVTAAFTPADPSAFQPSTSAASALSIVPGVTFAIAGNSTIPRQLALADLKALYRCDPNYVGTGPNYALHPLLPQTGSLRTTWESMLGIADSDVTAGAYPCIRTTVSGQPVTADNTVALDSNSLVPIDISAYLNQSQGLAPDVRGTAIPGTIGGVAPVVATPGQSITFAITGSSNIPRQLALSDLKALYRCDPNYVGTGPNYTLHPLLPQTGSLRTAWETMLGITDADVTSGVYPCIRTTTTSGQTVTADNTVALDSNSLVPVDISAYLNQSQGLAPDVRGSAILGTIGSTAPAVVVSGTNAGTYTP